MNFSDFAANQENASSLESWVQNAILLRTSMDQKSFMNVKEYSLPPIVHYFDLVGKVKVNKLTNLATIKKDIENKIYDWLNLNCDFNTDINLSDFNKKFLNDSRVISCNLDMKVSNWIKSDSNTYYFDSSLAEITGENSGTWNQLIISSEDLAGNIVSIDELENKILTMEISYNYYSPGGSRTRN